LHQWLTENWKDVGLSTALGFRTVGQVYSWGNFPFVWQDGFWSIGAGEVRFGFAKSVMAYQFLNSEAEAQPP
jgi:hypothetical protein